MMEFNKLTVMLKDFGVTEASIKTNEGNYFKLLEYAHNLNVTATELFSTEGEISAFTIHTLGMRINIIKA